MLERHRPLAARTAALCHPDLRAQRLRRTLLLLALLAAVALLAPRPSAQTFIYGLNDKGKLSVNKTLLDSLKSGFDAEAGTGTEQRWWDLAVNGADRYALRLDGRVSKNGEPLYKLEFNLADVPRWLVLDVTETVVWALRSDGLISTNGADLANLPAGAFFFQDILPISDSTVYTLRSDGAVFKNTTNTPLIKFTAGNGASGQPDGAFVDTLWFALRLDADTGELVAMRRDGKIWKQDPSVVDDDPLPGVAVGALPYSPVNPQAPDDTELYQAFEENDEGDWFALHANGEVFSFSVLDPIVNIPGSAAGGLDEACTDLISTGGEEFLVVRWDGSVYDQDGTKLFEMASSGFRHIAFSDTPPDLTNFKNPKPVQALYKTKAIDGVPVTVPILASDIEKLPADLVVTAPDPLPAGAVWDDLTRTLTWATPTPAGTYKFVTTVSDGVNDPRTFNHTLKVLAPDVDPLKNKAPIPTKISPVQALVDHEISFQVFAVDPDGDPLTFSVNPVKPPFSNGATFDDVTNTFTWTPTFDDIGKATPKFKVSDGLKTVTLSVTIKVVNGLVFEVPPPPPPPGG